MGLTPVEKNISINNAVNRSLQNQARYEIYKKLIVNYYLTVNG